MESRKSVVYFCFIVVCFLHVSHAENMRPIIGVLAQANNDWKGYGDTFIRDTYFHFLQMAGARAVPIRVNESSEYYENLFKNINGVLYPGGGVNVVNSGYAKAARQLFDLAIKANDAGDYFPIWGTCLGFEQLAALVGGDDVLSSVEGENLALPLNFSMDYKKTRMYQGLTPDLYEYVSTKGGAQNMHHYGVLKKTFTENAKLSNFFNLLTTNTDKDGNTYVSSMEGKKYPIFGVQYHPEKNLFDWDIKLHVSHEKDAILFAQSLADFFVDQARQSNHAYPSIQDESKALIQNYPAAYLGEPSFYRLYFFNFSENEMKTEEDVYIVQYSYPVEAVMACYQDNLTVLVTFLLITCLMVALALGLRQMLLAKRLRVPKYSVLREQADTEKCAGVISEKAYVS